MRTLVIGDIHGNLDALEQVLDRAAYNPAADRIICLGDYVDGWDDSFEVVRTLLELQNNAAREHVYLMGNHDQWFKEVLDESFEYLSDEDYIIQKHFDWYYCGGKSTYRSYMHYGEEFAQIHKERFFDKLKYYHKEDNKLFVHAGFDLNIGLDYTVKFRKDELLWGRDFYRECFRKWSTNKSSDFHPGGFDRIYIGHTPTTRNGITQPTLMGNVVNLDQGCKTDGCLSLWVDGTDEFFQSD